jgi:hypothetical protein
MAYLRLVANIEHAKSQGEEFDQTTVQMNVLHDFAYDLIDVRFTPELVSSILKKIDKVDKTKVEELIDKISGEFA